MTILDYYKYASLATASYVRAGTLNPLDLDYQARFSELARQQTRLPLSIAQYLFDINNNYHAPVWNIRYYYGSDKPASEDAIAAADTSGFAATLFERDGEQVLAIRGTEPTADGRVDLLQADLAAIGILGMSFPQAVSMVNLILRMAAPTAERYVPQVHIQSALEPLSSRSVAIPGTRPVADEFGNFSIEQVTVYLDFSVTYVQGLELIDAGHPLTVTGHSLGGHLAILAARLFPDLINPEVHVYNAPGFDPATANYVSPLVALVQDELVTAMGTAAGYIDPVAYKLTNRLVDLFRATVLPNAALDFSGIDVINLESEDVRPGDDTSIVSSILTAQQVLGQETTVIEEPNSHVIEPFMDALALHALFAQLNPDLVLADTNALFKASSAQVKDSEERLTEALFKLFLQGEHFKNETPQGHLPISDATAGLLPDKEWIGKGQIDARDAFHDAVLRIQQAIQGSPSLRLESLVEKSANDLTLAATDPDPANTSAIAYRYAIKELNPFALAGVDYQTLHNASGELSLYDPGTRSGTLTQQWIEDRAVLLTWKNLAYTQDRDLVSGADDVRFVDLGTGITIEVSTQVGEGGNVQPAVDPRHVVFGGDGAEALTGGDHTADRLYAMDGTDILNGRGGDDYLEGGAGLDLYQYSASNALSSTGDRKSTRLNSSHGKLSRMPSSA